MKSVTLLREVLEFQNFKPEIEYGLKICNTLEEAGMSALSDLESRMGLEAYNIKQLDIIEACDEQFEALFELFKVKMEENRGHLDRPYYGLAQYGVEGFTGKVLVSIIAEPRWKDDFFTWADEQEDDLLSGGDF